MMEEQQTTKWVGINTLASTKHRLTDEKKEVTLQFGFGTVRRLESVNFI